MGALIQVACLSVCCVCVCAYMAALLAFSILRVPLLLRRLLEVLEV